MRNRDEDPVIERAYAALENQGTPRYAFRLPRVRGNCFQHSAILPLVRNGNMAEDGVPIRPGKTAGHPRVRLCVTTEPARERTPLLKETGPDAPTYPDYDMIVLLDVGNDCRHFERHCFTELSKTPDIAEVMKDLKSGVKEIEDAEKANEAARMLNPEYAQLRRELRGIEEDIQQIRKDRKLLQRKQGQANSIHQRLQALQAKIEIKVDAGELEQSLEHTLSAYIRAWRNSLKPTQFRNMFVEYMGEHGFPNLEAQAGQRLLFAIGGRRVAVYELGLSKDSLRMDQCGLPMSLGYDRQSDGSETTIEFPFYYMTELLSARNFNRVQTFGNGYFGYVPLVGGGELKADGTILDNFMVAGHMLIGRIDEQGRGWIAIVEKFVYGQIFASVDFYRAKGFLDFVAECAMNPEVRTETPKSDSTEGGGSPNAGASGSSASSGGQNEAESVVGAPN